MQWNLRFSCHCEQLLRQIAWGYITKAAIMRTTTEALDSNAVADAMGIHPVSFRRLCQHGEFVSPDIVDKQGYRWLPETVAPWIEAAQLRAAACEQFRVLKEESKGSWEWRKAGARSPAAFEATQPRYTQSA